MESKLKEATKRKAGGLCASVWRGMLLFMLLLLPGGRLCAQDGWKAQETNPQNYLYWVNGVGYRIDETSGTAKVVESAKDLQGNVSLPHVLTITRDKDGAEFSDYSYRVTAIGVKAFAERSSIASIFLGSEVTDIEGEAFKGCSQLKKVIYVGANAPKVAEGAFKGTGVNDVEAASGGEIVFTTPTGHGKLNATLNGKLIGSGTPAEKGELVVTATAAEHYMVASKSRRDGVYTTSEVGVTVDGNAVAASEVELDGERRSVTVKLQLDGAAGKRVEVAFMPQMVEVDYGVLQSQARVFAKNDNKSSELHYENGGTLTATVNSGEEVEYGAQVNYTAYPGSGATFGWDKWALESWRVGGEEVAGANGTSFSRLADGQQVQVRFKRTQFLIRCNYGSLEWPAGWSGNRWVRNGKWRPIVIFGTNGSIGEGKGLWLNKEAQGEFLRGGDIPNYSVEVGFLANGAWIRGKKYTLLEDTYVDVFVTTSNLYSILLTVSEGPGTVEVLQDNNVIAQRGELKRTPQAVVNAVPNKSLQAELRSLTIQGAQVPIASPKDGVKNLSTTVPSDVLRVFATFAQPGQQVVTITEEGLCRVTVLRDERELRNGDEVRPGDRLNIAWELTEEEDDSGRFKLVSLTVNGAPFTSGDEFVVGNDDVNISAIAGKYPKENTKPSFLSYRVFGPGNVKFTRFDSWGQSVALVAGSLIDGNTFTPTATPDAGARLVRLTANGKDIESGEPFSDFENGKDVYVEAVFAKRDAYVCLQKVTAGSGYIEVLRHGERLRPGEQVVAGEQLTIVAKPSVKAEAKNELKLLTVNGVPWESGREYTVPDRQDVSVEAIFGSMDDHMVLLSQRGEGYVTLKKEGGGTIDEFPYLLPNGEKGPFEVNATPTYGWKLESLYWGDQAIASGTSGLLVGDDDITVFAHFVKDGSKEQHLYLPIVSGGKVVVTRNGKSLGSAAKITKGEKLTITAQPESGYRVVGPIYVNGEPFVGTQYEVPAKGNVEVKASFAKLEEVILSLVNVGKGVLQADQGGKVVRHGGVIGTRGNGGSVKVEKDVVVSAKPGRGQQLVSLTVDGKAVNATESNGLYTYTIVAALIKDDVTVRAVFGPQGAQVLTIDVEGNAGGSVKVYKENQAGGKEYLNSGSVVSGATLSFEVKVAEGWKSTEFLVNGTTQDPSKTFQVGSENVRVRAKFEKVDYTLSVETLPADGSRGTVKVELAGSAVISGATIHIGDRLKVTTELKPGNEVKGVSVTGAKQVGTDEYEVLRDTKVAVTFGEKGKPVLFVDVQPSAAAGKVEVLDAAGVTLGAGTALTKGAQLKVTATPAKDYKLAQLTLNGVGIHSPESITVGDEVKIVAYFEKETPGSRLGLYRLIEGGGKGTVAVTRNGELVYDGAETLSAGDELSITATPDGGSRLVTLQVNGVDVSNPRVGYTVRSAVTVKAVFAREGEYAMSIAESGPGRVKVRRNGQILLGGEPVKTDDRLEITAVPDANAHMSSLTVDGQPFVSGQSVTVTNHDIRIEAAFAADSDPMVLTLRSTGGGVLRVIRKDRELGQNEKLAKDDELTVVAKPDDGYRLDLLLVNGEQKTSGYAHRVAAGESVTVEARFAKNDTKTLQLLPGVGGMLVAKDRGTNKELVSNSELHEGQNIDIIATANPGNTIKEIKINEVSHPAATAEKEKQTVEYTVTAADETVIVEGSFEQKEYLLNAIALGGDGKGNVVVTRKGVVLTPGSSTVCYGDELKIAVTPTDGKCEGVWVNDVRLAGESPYQYQVSTSDVTIRVLFVKDGSKKILYTYEVRKEGGAKGSLTVTKKGETQPLAFGAELESGVELHIKAAAESGSYLSSLTVNEEEQDVKATEVVWTVPKTVAGGAVNVVAEFLPVGQQKLEVLANGPGEVRVTSMDGLKLYQNGSLVSEDTRLLVTVNPNAGSICKLFTINGAAQKLVNNQVSFTVVKEGAKIWAEFGSSAEYKLYYQNPVVGIITVTDVTRNSKLESGAVLTKGQKLRIEAAPRLVGSYALKELKVNGEAKASGVEIEVEDKDVLVEALFAKARSLTVTVNPTAVGSDKVVVKDATSDQVLSDWVAEGQKIKIEATAVPGYDQTAPTVAVLSGLEGPVDEVYTVKADVQVKVTYTPNEYTLMVAVDGNANGGATVKVGGVALTLSGGAKGTATVKYGDELTVEAKEIVGYEVTVNPEGTIKVEGDVTVEVSYTAKEYTLTVAVEGNLNDGGATVTVGGAALTLSEGAKGTATVKYGDELTVEPVAVAGYNAVVSPTSPISVTGDVNVKVSYTPKEYTLTVTVEGNPSNGGATVKVGGTVLTLTEGAKGTATVKYGDELTVEPVEVAGYNAVVNPASPITVADDVNVKVSYTPKEYTLTVTVEGNPNNGGATVKVGGVDLTLSEGAKGTATVKYGDELTVEPVEVAGYNAVVSPASPITVAGDVNVKVSYTSKEYTLTVSVEGNLNDGGAMVTVGGAALTLSEGVKGTATVKYGDELTVEPVAVAGYNVEVSPAGPITVAGDVNVKVSYTAKEYTLTVSVEGNLNDGGATVTVGGAALPLSEGAKGTATVKYGDELTVEPVEVAGYNAVVSPASPITVAGDVTVEVSYTPKEYTLTVTVEGNPNDGGATVTVGGAALTLSEGAKGTATVKYGDELTVEPVAVAGYNAVVSPAGPIAVAGDVNVKVSYTAKEYTLTVSVEGNLNDGGATVTVGGAALPLSEGAKGTATVKYGDELTVEPVEVAGYNVEVSPAGPITVAGDVNVKVSYTPKEYTLTVAVEGNLNDGGATVKVGGTALPLSEGAKGTATVKYGDELTVEPVEVAGYNAVVSPASPITVAGDVNVKVSYTPKEYTLTVAVEGNSSNGGATVTVGGAALPLSEGAKGTATVKYGDELTVEPVEVAGYNAEVSPAGPITVADDVTVEVSYTPKEYTLTVAVEGNLNDGGATVTVGGAALTLSEGAKGTATVKYGDELTVEPVAVAGYNAVVSPASPITVADDVTVEVSYTPKEYTLTVTVEGNPNNGGATVTVGGAALTLSEGAKGTATVKYGDELTVEPVAVAGYNVEVSPTGPITVADDVNVKVSYTAKETAVESVLLSAATLTPNPASVVVRLSNAEAAKSYAVYTLRGAEVMRGVLAGESVVAIDVTLLADGVYLLRVEAADGARVLRFVVAR